MIRLVATLGCLLLVLSGGCRKRPGSRAQNKRAQLDPPKLSPRLPVTKELPDPFRFKDGKRVRRRGHWPRRRQEIKQTLMTHQYGRLPRAPGLASVAHELTREPVFEGGGIRTRIRLTVGKQLQLQLGLTAPMGDGPFPAIVHIDHRGLFKVDSASEIVRRGYVLVDYDPTFLDPDEKGMVGPAQAAYADHDWATLAVWAWGAMRVADYLRGATLSQIDGKRLVVTGHSRSGKAALLAGALDDRFAVVAPQGSGCGGMASYRYIGSDGESLDQITRSFPHWFHPNLRRFAGHVQRLPFDQHFVSALVAPRALISIDAAGDLWASPRSTQQTYLATREVYRFLGAEDKLGIHLRPGRHELSPADWRTLMAFADRALLGKEGPRFDTLPFPGDKPRFSWSAP